MKIWRWEDLIIWQQLMVFSKVEGNFDEDVWNDNDCLIIIFRWYKCFSYQLILNLFILIW